MKKCFLFLILFYSINSLFGQTKVDSIVFDNKTVFKDGIYTSLEELKYNAPKYPDAELEIDKNQKRVYLKDVYFRNARNTRLKLESNLYATVLEGHLSVFYDNQLNSIFLKGAISTFILNEIITTTTYQDQGNMGYGYPGGYGTPGYGMPTQTVPVTTSHEEVNIYYLDFITGTISKVTKENLEPVIMRDMVLYSTFKKIKGDSNNKKSYPFISQYNERNKVYIKVVSSPQLKEE